MTVTSSPVAPARPAPCNPGRSTAYVRGCARAKGAVLLVEGDATIAELFATILRDEGYPVERASTPHTALALLGDCSCRHGVLPATQPEQLKLLDF